MVPKLRFKEFCGEWEEKRLGDNTFVITKGTTPKNFELEGVKYIKIEAIQGSNIDNNRCMYISDKAHLNELKRSILEEDDIVFAIAGATIGKCALIKKENLPANTNQALSIIRLKDTMDKVFVLNILKSSIMKKYIYKNLIIGAQPNLNLEQISNFKFSCPSLPEQTKIADFLSTVDDKIQNQQDKITHLENIKKGFMQKIFSRKIRFKDDGGEEFLEWEEKKLGDICKMFSGGTPTSGKSEYYGGNINFIRSGEIHLNKTELTLTKLGFDSSSAKLVEIGDILYALYGATSGEVNISKIDGAINQAILCIRPDKYYNKKYLVEILNFKKMNILNTYLQGGQGNLSGEIIKNLKFKFPCLKEQQKIADFLSSFDEKISTEKETLEHIKQLKKGLLQQMFI